MSEIRWSYALNQWRPTYDTFVRREQHERALKTTSVSGFRAVELACGAGRWEPMGNLEMIVANHGGVEGLKAFLGSCAIDAVSSYAFDPGAFLSLAGPPLAAANPANRPEIVKLAREYVGMLPSLGGDRLVVNAAPAYWRTGGLTDELLGNLAACWNEVAAVAAEGGVQVSMHLDCVSAVRTEESIARLLSATDPGVGLCIDTAELTLAGLDPLAVYRQFSDRVNHVQFKDVLLRDDLGEAMQPHAEAHFLSGGGSRQVARWFYEMGAPGGLVDFPALLSAMKASEYSGWVVVESDQSPYPATSTMLNGWYLKHRLGQPTR